MAAAAVRTALLVMLMLAVSRGTAETVSGMKGFKFIDLVIEKVSDKAESCGITRTRLDTIVRLAAANGPVRFNSKTTADVPYLYLRVTAGTAANDSICVASIALQYVRHLPVRGGDHVSAITWETGTLLSAPPKEMPDLLERSVERFTKDFMGEWLRSNP